jgi:hypothetical protein
VDFKSDLRVTYSIRVKRFPNLPCSGPRNPLGL